MCVGLAFSKKRMEALGRVAPPRLPPVAILSRFCFLMPRIGGMDLILAMNMGLVRDV